MYSNLIVCEKERREGWGEPGGTIRRLETEKRWRKNGGKRREMGGGEKGATRR